MYESDKKKRQTIPNQLRTGLGLCQTLFHPYGSGITDAVLKSKCRWSGVDVCILKTFFDIIFSPYVCLSDNLFSLFAGHFCFSFFLNLCITTYRKDFSSAYSNDNRSAYRVE